MGRPTVAVVICAAGPAPHARLAVELALDRGWAVRAVTTPAARSFVDATELAALTGAPVVSEYRLPSEPRAIEIPDAFVVAPATYNTVCKLAVGVADTYALSLLAEGIGLAVPVAILPYVNAALASRKPYREAVESLRSEGVRIVTGQHRVEAFPWAAALDTAGVTRDLASSP
ncbi:flavoprotein [Phytohabitans suffuscus]|uniref:Flavoprotein n=1 Tax=Phytohabitans suffuscus TaxID=624315 RepID=A0A6F8YUD0_9ACTN|nr:flavoprotein [Phytohabitans suffuscus]BCB89441.1 flavoprotein [Phytohabitans suffuscus]